MADQLTPKQLTETCISFQQAIDGANLEVNFSGEDGGVQIHWCGVIQLNTTPSGAATAIRLFKQLEALGAKDC